MRGDELELAIRLALTFGLRRGEVAGIHWDDVNFTAGTLTINGSLGSIMGQGLVYGPPKTDSGRRTFKLTADLIAAFRWRKTHLEAQREAMGDKWKDSPYVFVSTKTGGPINPPGFTTASSAPPRRSALMPACTTYATPAPVTW
jgi:integrase